MSFDNDQGSLGRIKRVGGATCGGAGGSSESAMGNPRGGSAPKSILVTLCSEETFRTNGTQTRTVTLYDLPQVRRLGPLINRIRVHWLVEGASGANFQGGVTLAWSVAGRTWSNPVDLLALTANNAELIGAWYTTDGNFGLNMRYSIDVANLAGSVQEFGRVTCVLEIELKS